MAESPLDNIDEAAAPQGLGRLFRNRRILMGLGGAVLVLLLLVGLLLRSQPRQDKEKEYPLQILYENLTDVQTTRVIQELSYLNIKFTVVKEGKLSKITVPSNKIDFATQRLAQKGMPFGGTPGFELFDVADGLGATEFDKRIKYIRAVSGEIERSIARLSPVKTAKVQIVVPERKLFSINQEPVKASVLIDLLRGQTLAAEQIYGIIQLTAHSVEGLNPKDVSVVDIHGNLLSQGIVEQAYREQLAMQNGEEFSDGNTAEGSRVELPETRQPQDAEPKKMMTPGDSGLNWLKANESFENHLKQKVRERLGLFLPPESFRVEVNAHFKAIADNVPVIEKIDCSVVLDSNDSRIYLDDIEKNKIFSAVSDAIGYKKERDQIFLRRVNFRELPKAEQPKEGVTTNRRALSLYDLLLGAPYVRWAALGFLFLCFMLMVLIRRWRRSRARADELLQDEEALQVPEETPAPQAAPQAMTLQDVLQTHQNDIGRIQNAAGENPDAFSQLIQSWLDEEKLEGVPA